MCTPTLVEARRIWPDAQITALCGPGNAALVAAASVVDMLEIAVADPLSWRRRSERGRLRCWLDRESFDLAIILLGDQFAALLSDAGIPVIVGAAGTAMSGCLTATYDIGSPRTWGPRERLGSLRCLGFDVACSTPKLRLSEAAVANVERLLTERGLPQRTLLVALHPFGSTARQRWPLERIGPLAENLRLGGRHTVLLGGPETRGRLAPHPDVVDLTGALSVDDLLAVIARAEVVVTTDSGPFHIAGAFNRPTVGLFRARRPEHAARYPDASVLLRTVPECQRTCSWDSCDKDPCREMEALAVNDVLVAVKERLSAS